MRITIFVKIDLAVYINVIYFLFPYSVMILLNAWINRNGVKYKMIKSTLFIRRIIDGNPFTLKDDTSNDDILIRNVDAKR